MGEVIGNPPFMPVEMLYVLGVMIVLGLVLLLRDMHSWNRGWTHALGVTFVTVSIWGFAIWGVWNIAVGTRALQAQNEFAVAAPLER